MQCDYFDAARCRSCALMGVPYAVQLADKQDRCVAALAGSVPAEVWLPAVSGPESGFRNKAKLVVGGSAGAVTLGILDDAGHGVDLRECGLYEPGLAAALPRIAEFIDEISLLPYDVPTRQGELKHVIDTHSPTGQLMIRFVLRSRRHETLLRKHLPRLQTLVPSTAVVSLNLQPEHKAVLEGDAEIILSDADSLPMRVNDITLHLRPNSFFQTNTVVAAALYRQSEPGV
jgi:23S rRNA (uracil747-C5)-methyltransferase